MPVHLVNGVNKRKRKKEKNQKKGGKILKTLLCVPSNKPAFEAAFTFQFIKD